MQDHNANAQATNHTIVEVKEALERIRNRTYLMERTMVNKDYEECGMEAVCMLAIENYKDVDFIEKHLATAAPSDEGQAI